MLAPCSSRRKRILVWYRWKVRPAAVPSSLLERGEPWRPWSPATLRLRVNCTQRALPQEYFFMSRLRRRLWRPSRTSRQTKVIIRLRQSERMRGNLTRYILSRPCVIFCRLGIILQMRRQGRRVQRRRRNSWFTSKALSEAPRVRSLMLRSMRLREWILSACVLSISATGAVAGLPYCKAGPQTGRPLDTYVPVDSWVYPALDRLHGLGYLDTAFLGIRPWTRRSRSEERRV